MKFAEHIGLNRTLSAVMNDECALLGLQWLVSAIFDQCLNNEVKGVVIVIMDHQCLRCLNELVKFLLELNFKIEAEKWV